MSDTLDLAAPWINYARKMTCLFDADPEITVEWDPDDIEVTLYVENPQKASALEELLPGHVNFGNVTLYITVIPANKSYSTVDLFRFAFAGNPVLEDVVIADPGAAFDYNYCIFKNDTVQFPSDNMTSYYGLTTTLYEDIAKEVFEDSAKGVYFCTAPKE